MTKSVEILPLILLFLFSCNKNHSQNVTSNKNDTLIHAVDISSYPEISQTAPVFYDLQQNPKEFLQILKEQGVNTVRIRLWVNPINAHSGFQEVKSFSQIARSAGFKIWLTLHYSDTWADPSAQQTPATWQGLDFTNLKDTMYNYTKKVVIQMQPDYIQIGNEINSGILFPAGNINTNPQQCIDLLKTGVAAVRQNAANCKIILHYAGIQGVDWFFNQVKTIDFDIIGLSYYPIWHGKSMNDLKFTMKMLSDNYQKKIMIAETAYPFTLGWNDWTNNIVGLSSQLILPDYPATPEGQRTFIHQIKTIVKETPNGIGFCYWGGELIAWNGSQSTNGSPWENQALFDFTNKALPLLNEFKEQ